MEETKKTDIKKIITSEVFLYLFFGGLTTVVSIASYWFFSSVFGSDGAVTSLEIQISNVLSWILAVSFAYVTNKIFVFKSKTHGLGELRREAGSFVGARLFSLVVECLWMFVTTAMGMNDKLAKLIGQIFVVILNYILSKLFIFNKKEKKNEK